jgi:hypothetical protein
MKKLLLSAAAAVLLGVSGYAIAQTIVVPQVASVNAGDLFLDVVNGVPTAPGVYASAGQIGNVASVSYSVPVTAFSITQGTAVTWTVLNPAGTLATGTFTFEAAPTNGTRACVVTTQTQTAMTFTGNTGQTVTGAPTAMAAGTPVCFLYVASVSTWFRT